VTTLNWTNSLLAGLIAIFATPAFAQMSEQFRQCGSIAKTQTQIDSCALQELRRAEGELSERYTKLGAIFGKNAKALEKVKAMQGAWSAYRDSFIDAMFPAEDKQDYGTIYESSAALYRARLTRQQTVAVDLILEEYKPK
jgi:uncharacterized protein YecT (DUF1311 family)